MSVYKYIAENNPNSAYEVCKKYGFFQISDEQHMADCLEEIVAKGGEESITDVMDLHPDKEVILELFQKKNDDLDKPHTKQECGCKNSSFQNRKRLARFANANAGQKNIANQTNTYILIGALVISIAIISAIKKQ
jgi:hypothetical protein